MADKLVEAGWAYPCFCTEEELSAKREQVRTVYAEGICAIPYIYIVVPLWSADWHS